MMDIYHDYMMVMYQDLLYDGDVSRFILMFFLFLFFYSDAKSLFMFSI